MAKGFQDERYRKVIGLLVARRAELGLSQASLAKMLRTHQQFVSRYETGERRLDVVELIDIAETLGLNPVGVIEAVTGGRSHLTNDIEHAR